MYNSSSRSTVEHSEKMAAGTLVAIGTQGTIGSLLMREIEYFSKAELNKQGSCNNASIHDAKDKTYSRGNSMLSFLFPITGWKRKRQRPSFGFLPRFCSAVRVAEINPPNKIPRYSYKILKEDT